MQTFAGEQEAKEFLIGKILGQARRNGYPFSEIERKMLYFSETGWTLPDALENKELFDREHDLKTFEWKVRRMAWNYGKVAGPEAMAEWNEAITTLSAGDHYLVKLINSAGEAQLLSREGAKRLGVAIVVVIVILAGRFLYFAFTR